MRGLWRSLVALCVVSLATLAAPDAALADRRVALVIGNSDYRDVARLGNPATDARLVARTLRQQGFELVGGDAQVDLDKPRFDAVLQSFGDQAQGADVALFYYAGHGVQLDGRNFLVPIEANPRKEADVYLQMVDTSIVLSQMEGAGAKLNMLLLDACRNNPFGGRGLRATGGGLALMQAPEGTIISYATQPGNIALDGSNGDSPYTLALVDTIKRPGLGLFEAFNEIGLAVKRATGGAQQPWVSSSPIAGGFYFAGSAADRPAAEAVAAPIGPETITAASLDRATAKTTPRDTMVAALTPPPLVARTEAPVEACDRLAAPPLDRPAPIGGVEFDDLDAAKAVPACRAAVAAQPDNPRLVFELVRSLLKNGDEAEVKAMFRDAAVAGHAAAMNSLAIAYENGRGLPGDIVQAARWYAKSAEAGNSAAMIRLGWLYENGRGVPIDAGEALRWFRRSAEVGNAAGMVAVGEAYDKGLGAPKDPIEAARWYAKAAEVGNAAGMNHLGFAYLGGIGVGRDPVEAVRWFRRSADAGNKQAMQRLGDAYAGGVGVGLDKTEAERWYRKARE